MTYRPPSPQPPREASPLPGTETTSFVPAVHSIVRYSVAQVDRMIAAGAFVGEGKAELLNGFVIEKMPIGPKHASTLRRLRKLVEPRLPEGSVLGIQDPIGLTALSRPEPDLWVAAGTEGDYSETLPTAGQLLLLIEVADSSLAFDLGDKMRLYAGAGVAEYWVVDIAGERIWRHASPAGEAGYGVVRAFAKTDSLAHDALGELSVAELFA